MLIKKGDKMWKCLYFQQYREKKEMINTNTENYYYILPLVFQTKNNAIKYYYYFVNLATDHFLTITI